MLKASFMNDQDYTAQDFATYFSKVLTNGVFSNPSTSLQVLANDNYDVTVKSGFGYVKGYLFENTSDYNLPIDVADGVLNRIDLVVMRLDLNSQLITLDKLKGTPATNPTAPALTRNEIIYEIALAQLYVGKGATKIIQADITDTRGNNDLCGFVNSLIQADTTTIFNNYNSWYETKTAQYQSDWDAWFGGAKESNDPTKQNKITYGANFPSGPVTGDWHMKDHPSVVGAFVVYRYVDSTAGWVLILQSTDTNKFDKAGGTITGATTVNEALTAGNGFYIGAKAWTKGQGRIYQNAADASNNYGLVITSGADNSGKGIEVSLSPINETLFLKKKDGVNYEIKHEGNKNIDYFQIATDTVLATATYKNIDTGYAAGATWDATNKQYIVPKTGKYRIVATINFDAITSAGAMIYIKTKLNGTTDSFLSRKISSGNNDTLICEVTKDMTAGDKIAIQAFVETGTATIKSGWSHLLFEKI